MLKRYAIASSAHTFTALWRGVSPPCLVTEADDTLVRQLRAAFRAPDPTTFMPHTYSVLNVYVRVQPH